MIGAELLYSTRLSGDPDNPMPYAGGGLRSFGLDAVTRWGRLSRLGDEAGRWVAEVDGHHYMVVGGERTPEDAAFLGRMRMVLHVAILRPGGLTWDIQWASQDSLKEALTESRVLRAAQP